MLHYVTDTGRIEQLSATAVPLGFFPDMRWPPPVSLPMALGDMMVVVTDGCFEWRNEEGEEYGIDRLAEAVRRHRNEPAATMICRLNDELARFVGPVPQPDDLTALVIKRR